MAAGNPNFRTFPIPCQRGHDVVYGLARGRGEEIYLAPSNEFAPGLCAAVYAFDPATERFREIIDIRKATGFDAASGQMPHSKVHLCLQSTASGRAFAATHFTAPAVGQTSFDAVAAFRGGYPGTYLLEYDPAGDRVVNHGLLAPGEGARIACLDERHEQYYFLSYPRNHLFRYDYGRKRLHDLGRMGQENSFGLEVDEAGDVYTSDDLGRFWRYSLARDRLEALDLFVPLAPGRSPKGNYIRRMALGTDGCFYGCGNKGARFFRLDPKALALEDFGVLVGGERAGPAGYPLLPPAKAIAAQADGSLLIAFGGDGVYLDADPVPHLVRFEPGARRLTDLGRFVDGEDGLPAWIPQCAVAAREGGETYFGLQQTVGGLRLWRYGAGGVGGGGALRAQQDDKRRARRFHDGQQDDELRRGFHDGQQGGELRRGFHDGQQGDELRRGFHDGQQGDELRRGFHDGQQGDELRRGFHDEHLAAVARQPFGASVEGVARLAFVRQGTVQMQELGWLGEDRVIAAGEAAVAALAFGNERVLYGVTVGARCHLFAYRPDQQNRFTENYEVHPWDLGVVGDGPAEAARLFADPGAERLIVAVRRPQGCEFWTYPIGAEASAYRGVYHSVPHGPAVGWASPPCERAGEAGPAAFDWQSLTYLAAQKRFYAVNADGGLISAEVGGTWTEAAGAGKGPVLSWIEAGPGAGLWAGTPRGEVLAGEMDGAAFVARPVGRFAGLVSARSVSRAGSLALGGTRGALALFARGAAGCGGGAGQLAPTLSGDAAAWQGILRRQAPVRCLAWHGENVLWGFSGGEPDLGEAFCLRAGKLQELGILQVPSQPRYWTAHRCDAVAVSPAGEAFFGEFDRIAHLFRVSP